LDEKPVTEKNESWDLHELEKEENGYQGEYAGPGMEKEIGSHDP